MIEHKNESTPFHDLSDEAEADAEPDADEIDGVKTMVRQTDELHHHVDEKIREQGRHVEKGKIQFSIRPATKFKNLVKHSHCNGKE